MHLPPPGLPAFSVVRPSVVASAQPLVPLSPPGSAAVHSVAGPPAAAPREARLVRSPPPEVPAVHSVARPRAAVPRRAVASSKTCAGRSVPAVGKQLHLASATPAVHQPSDARLSRKKSLARVPGCKCKHVVHPSVTPERMRVTRNLESLDYERIAVVSAPSKRSRVQHNAFVLDVFSRCGELSKALRRLNLATSEIEILRDSKFDISDRRVQLLMLRWIR